MTDREMAEDWADKEYDDLRYEKCQTKYFVFIFDQLKEMGKQAFFAGLNAKTQWHKSDEIQSYDDIPQNKDILYVWIVNERKYEKDRPIIKIKVGTQDELVYDIMAYHLIAWYEIPTFDKELL